MSHNKRTVDLLRLLTETSRLVNEASARELYNTLDYADQTAVFGQMLSLVPRAMIAEAPITPPRALMRGDWRLSKTPFAVVTTDRKIPMIKLLRAVSGFGLKEAKDTIESILDDGPTIEGALERMFTGGVQIDHQWINNLSDVQIMFRSWGLNFEYCPYIN